MLLKELVRVTGRADQVFTIVFPLTDLVLRPFE